MITKENLGLSLIPAIVIAVLSYFTYWYIPILIFITIYFMMSYSFSLIDDIAGKDDFIDELQERLRKHIEEKS